MTIISKQEMFDRAWNGLKAQGWRVSYKKDVGCVYKMQDGNKVLRCAWGHVDPEGTEHCESSASVETLRNLSIGLAGFLDYGQLDFACALQQAHDRHRPSGSKVSRTMAEDFRRLAAFEGLTIPGER